ncbi:MAG: NAD(+) diphosphatase [Prevotella sp.]|nr:NAD(+) diphosphatase [Prevotella sp.]MBR6320081.1 NAD(+) diphosphatase [Prevotella sp.]
MPRYYFVFCKDALLLWPQEDGSYTIPLQEEPPTAVKPWTTILNVTPLDGIEVKTYSVDAPPAGQETCPLRQSYYKLPLPLYLKAGKCAELLYWDRNTRFCGVCGGMMHLHTDISKRCEMCGKEVWPQLATAVIVLIHRGPDEVLLARGRNFKSNFYGLIAGFVETGETLEQAVEREVMEEVGLRIKNIRYFDSQPWPYPSGLMVGFNADYDSGELHVQRDELRKAAWFHRDHLPQLPEKLSIARKLIDNWLIEN